MISGSTSGLFASFKGGCCFPVPAKQRAVGEAWAQACGVLSEILSRWGLGQTGLGGRGRRGQFQVGALTRGSSKTTKDGVRWVGRVPGAAKPCGGLLPHRACRASLSASTGTGAHSAHALLRPTSSPPGWAASLVSEVAAVGCSLAQGPGNTGGI